MKTLEDAVNDVMTFTKQCEGTLVERYADTAVLLRETVSLLYTSNGWYDKYSAFCADAAWQACQLYSACGCK